MPRSKPATAEDFIARLEANPAWVARRDAQLRELELLQAVHASDQAELVRELREVGLDIDGVYDLVNNTPHPDIERRFLGPYPSAYPILAKHLDIPHLVRIREGIIRALTVKDVGDNIASLLLQHFYSETDKNLRWVLANALQTTMSYYRRKKHPDIAAVLRGDN